MIASAVAAVLFATPDFIQVSETCHPTQATPHIEISIERGQPDVSSTKTISSLTSQSQGAGAYRPAGTEGPRWHTAGLTQSNIKIGYKIPNHGFVSGTNACYYIDSINVTITLDPVVWVANEFPANSCMYEVVRGHEMKHVNADRLVADKHVTQLRATLAQLSHGEAFFGPGKPDQVKADVAKFAEEIGAAIKSESASFFADEQAAQHAIDTLEEYQRVMKACPQGK